tara:strand:- start:2844 stop:3728 length:885 start_codon:yes stop_codon:yes gene_type:complete
MIRIIPRLDIKGPNIIKGLCYDGYRVLGKPELFSEIYYNEGADELFFQDAVASLYERNNLLDIVSLTAGKVMIPITVCGGIRNIEDITEALNAGADKVGINSAAIKKPDFLEKAARKFGSQCIVLSIEAKKIDNGKYEVWSDYGREPSGFGIKKWAKDAENFGIGEIYLSSVDNDGTGLGFDIDLINEITSYSKVPVIASGGAGNYDDFLEAINKTNLDAISAASVFHYNYANELKNKITNNKSSILRMGKHIDTGNIEFINEGYGGFDNIQVNLCSIKNLKVFLNENNINVRI